MKILKKEPFIILLLSLVCSFFYFFKLGGYRLIDVDEPRYAEAAREMIKSCDLVTPYFNYELRFDKPIFFYWLIALSYLVFGVCEFAARFPSAILATGLVFLTYYFGRTTISKSFGLVSSLILASSLEFIALARMSITDMTLAFFICAAIFCGLLATFAEGRSKKLWWWLAYLASAIAVLTKGPVGFVLPAMVLGLYLILTGKLKKSLKPIYLIPGLLIFVLSVVPWYWAIISLHSSFVDYFFLKHNLARFATFKQHAYPFYFYFIVVFAGFFPWIIYFISAMIKLFGELIGHIRSKMADLKKFKFAIFEGADNRLKVILATSIWFLTIFFLFSSSKAKLLTYILPIFPAISLFTGIIWNEFISENKNARRINISARILTGLCFIMALVALFGLNYVIPRDEKLLTSYNNMTLLGIFIVIPVIMLIYLYKNQKIKAFSATIIMMMAVSLTVLTSVLPVIYDAGPKDLVGFAQLSNTPAFSGRKLHTYKLIKPSIIFYSQKRVPKIKTKEDFYQIISGSQPVLVIVRNRHLKREISKFHFHVIQKGVKYSLISNCEGENVFK